MPDFFAVFSSWLHPVPAPSVPPAPEILPDGSTRTLTGEWTVPADVSVTVTPAVDTAPLPVADPVAGIPGLEAALHAAAPHADPAVWVPALTDAFIKGDMTAPKRFCAALGQASVEAGSGFQELAENTNYTSSARLLAIFPREFTPASAAADAGHPQLIANQAYAGRLGNGSAATNDGWNFRGHGLIQVTGRTEFTAFAAWCGRTVENAAAWALTPAGAAMTLAWYWSANNLNALADAWDLEGITRRVNGSAELGLSQREAAANAALAAVGG